MLKEEILTGVLSTELLPLVSTGEDGKIVAILNEKRFTKISIIKTIHIQRYLFLRGLLLKIETKSNDIRTQTARALELFTEFDLSSETDYNMFCSLADALILDSELGFLQSDKDALLNIATIKISRAEQMGIDISIEAVATALRTES